MKKYWWIGLVVGCVVGGVVWLLLWHGGHVYHGDGYTLAPPAGWQAVPFRLVDVAFVAPPSQAEERFRSNITVVAVPRGDDIATSGQAFRKILAGLDVPAHHFALLGKRDFDLDGRKCSSLDYTIVQRGQTLKGTIIMVDAIKTYIFSYTTLVDRHPVYLDAFRHMVASLRNG